jgi:DNA polymerase-4
MDAFFAAVELRRHPELRGQPVVVGGAGPRGVVAAASYEARAYGIHSAMPSVQAKRRCPHAVFLPGDHRHYAEVSESVMTILRGYTPLVEPLSLDEAFLDVTGARRVHGEPVPIAHEVRARVQDAEALACSVGVAPNKFLAKLASQEAKPRPSLDGPRPGEGVTVVVPGRELDFLHPLPVERLWGVGPATLARLSRLGVGTVGELARLPEAALVASLGAAHGHHLYELAHGRDDRPVEPERAPKSIAHEETFARDLHEPAAIEREVVRMADAVASRVRHAGLGGRTVTVKVRFADFRTITRSVTLGAATDVTAEVVRAAKQLVAEVDPGIGVRLLGVGVSNLTDEVHRQLTLDDTLAWEQADRAVDEIRDRFGRTSIGPASSLDDHGLRVKERGDQQWGPAD